MTKPTIHQDSLKPPARCLDCEYNIAYLSEHRCPECGRPFDPNDPTTYLGLRIEEHEPHHELLFICICIFSTFCMFLPLFNLVWLFIAAITAYAWYNKEQSCRATAGITLFYVLLTNILSVLMFI